jgi:hypothetical protein
MNSTLNKMVGACLGLTPLHGMLPDDEKRLIAISKSLIVVFVDNVAFSLINLLQKEFFYGLIKTHDSYRTIKIPTHGFPL